MDKHTYTVMSMIEKTYSLWPNRIGLNFKYTFEIII